MINHTSICDSQFAASVLNRSLNALIVEQTVCAHPQDTQHIKARVHQNRHVVSKEHSLEIRNSFSPQLQRAVDLNSEPGASSWLLVLPLHDQSFHLTKQEFWDAFHLHYGGLC